MMNTPTAPDKGGEADGAPVAVVVPGSWSGSVESYVLHYGGRCRDCADHDGVCPASGLPCDQTAAGRAARHAVAAVNYGLAHGYLRILAALPHTGEQSGDAPVAWRVRAGVNHPLVEGKPFDWRLSESKPTLGEGARPEWFDVEPLYTHPAATQQPTGEGVGSERRCEALRKALQSVARGDFNHGSKRTHRNASAYAAWALRNIER